MVELVERDTSAELTSAKLKVTSCLKSLGAARGLGSLFPKSCGDGTARRGGPCAACTD